MDTKSRKSRFKLSYKVVAWALCIASACLGTLAYREIASTEISSPVPSYVESQEAITPTLDTLQMLENAYFAPTEAEIDTAVDTYVREMDAKMEEELQAISDMYTSEYSAWADMVSEMMDSGVPGALGSADAADEGTVEMAVTEAEVSALAASEVTMEDGAQSQEGSSAAQAYRQQRIEEIQQKYSGLIENARQTVTAQMEEAQAAQKRILENNKDFYYAVLDGGEVTMTNVNGDDPAGVILEQQAAVSALYTQQEMQHYAYGQPEVQSVSEGSSGQTVLMTAMRPEVFAENEMDYAARYGAYQMWFVISILSIVLFVAGMVWLIYTAGKTPDDYEKPKLHKMDQIVYLDIGFFIMIAVEAGLILLLSVSIGFIGNGQYMQPRLDAAGVFAVCACMAGIVSVFFMWLLSLVRWNKHGRAYRFTLAYAIFGGIRNMQRAANLDVRTAGALVWYIIAGIVCSIVLISGIYFDVWLTVLIGAVLLVIYIALSLKYFLGRAADIKAVETGVTAIKEGDTDYQITVRDHAEIRNIADGINNIAEGLSSAVKKEVKSERMKTELITNISHDLKTPLTSILTYVDLLKKEQQLGENAQKYLDILDAKSTRLKVLTDDLFEAAKASSGDLTVGLSHVELTQFLEQAFAEWADKIDASDITFEMPGLRDKLYAIADGRMLFRVVGNAIDNAIKYSLPGSRVYVDVAADGEQVCIVIKNVSREKLNITEEELMERFVRGDSSRNTEGSGLGLSIAQNLMKLMGGQFVIDIDGDLFKVCICLPQMARELEESEQAPLQEGQG